MEEKSRAERQAQSEAKNAAAPKGPQRVLKALKRVNARLYKTLKKLAE